MTALLSCSKKMTMILNKVISGKEYICQVLQDKNSDSNYDCKMNVFDDGCVLIAGTRVKSTSSKEVHMDTFIQVVENYVQFNKENKL